MNKFRIAALPLGLVLCILPVRAQSQEGNPLPPPPPGGGRGVMHEYPQGDRYLLNLTDQQKEQMRKLNLSLAEKTLPLRNELAEKETHLRTLVTARDPDRAAVDKAAEEIGNLRTELFRAHVANEMKIRDVLSEEQRALRDARPEGPDAPPHPRGDIEGPVR